MDRRGALSLIAGTVDQVWERAALVAVAGCTGAPSGGVVVGVGGRLGDGWRWVLAAGVARVASRRLRCYGGRRGSIGGGAGGEDGGAAQALLAAGLYLGVASRGETPLECIMSVLFTERERKRSRNAPASSPP